MAAKTDIESFVRTFCTTGLNNGKSYGSFYVVANANTQILMYLDNTAARGSLESIKVALLKTISNTGQKIIFYSTREFSNRRNSRYMMPSLAKATVGSNAFELPRDINAKYDLTKLKIIDSALINLNTNDFLFELPEKRFLITYVPDKLVTKFEFETRNFDNITEPIVIPVSGGVTSITEARKRLTPNEIPDDAKYVEGTWILPTKFTLEDKPEFLIQEHELKTLKNRPFVLDYIANYDSMVNIEGAYPRFSSISGNSPNIEQLSNTFKADVVAWELTAEAIKAKYYKPFKRVFTSDVALKSLNTISYFHETPNGEMYFMGDLCTGSYSNVVVYSTGEYWHRLIPVINTQGA